MNDINSYNTLIPENLLRFKSKFFVETGSNYGLGIKVALECGFEQIYSCDINQKYYDICLDLYKNNNNVNLYLTDSINFLNNMSEKVKNNITFWLDAHNESNDRCPLIRELEILKNKYDNTNTILVDDINLLGTSWAKSLNLDMIQKKILEINSNYKIEILERKCKYGGHLLAAFL